MSKTSHQKHEQKQKSKHHVTQNSSKPSKSHEDYQAHSFGDVIIVLLIIGLGIVFILPFYAVMPAAARYATIIVFGITIALFAASLWKQKPVDMAVTHPQTAAHLAYLATVVVLACVIILQLLSGRLDIWLIVILTAILVVRNLLVLGHNPE